MGFNMNTLKSILLLFTLIYAAFNFQSCGKTNSMLKEDCADMGGLYLYYDILNITYCDIYSSNLTQFDRYSYNSILEHWYYQKTVYAREGYTFNLEQYKNQ
jgi:hypothetical protein